MLVDDAYAIPADADAVILAPSLVADRYVQFAPVYSGGDRMASGAVVPLERTATPVELDQVYGALDDLSTALGPTGANADGCAVGPVDVAAANLDGNGQALNDTLSGFSQAVRTLADNRDDLFASVENLQTFTSALATIDSQVGQFNQNLAAVAEQLAGERQDLAQAISLLNSALGQVATFVQQNTALLTTNVDRLADVTLTLVQQRQALAQVLDVALPPSATWRTRTTPTTARWTPGTTRWQPERRRRGLPAAGPGGPAAARGDRPDRPDGVAGPAPDRPGLRSHPVR